MGHPGVILLLKSAGLIFCGPRCYAVSGLGLGLAKAYAHRVSSNAASSLQACKRPSASSRMSRTETIKRLPLISGIRFSAGSMRSRSSGFPPSRLQECDALLDCLVGEAEVEEDGLTNHHRTHGFGRGQKEFGRREQKDDRLLCHAVSI